MTTQHTYVNEYRASQHNFVIHCACTSLHWYQLWNRRSEF